MRLRPHLAAIACLEAEELPEGTEEASPFSRETAVGFLKLFTGQDFGADASKWKAWLEEFGTDEQIEKCYENIDSFARKL